MQIKLCFLVLVAFATSTSIQISESRPEIPSAVGTAASVLPNTGPGVGTGASGIKAGVVAGSGVVSGVANGLKPPSPQQVPSVGASIVGSKVESLANKIGASGVALNNGGIANGSVANNGIGANTGASASTVAGIPSSPLGGSYIQKTSTSSPYSGSFGPAAEAVPASSDQTASSKVVTGPLADWLNPLSIEAFKKNKLFIPLWNATQVPLTLKQREALVPLMIDAFKLTDDIIDDSFASMKFILTAKVLAYYTPKLTSILFRHKFNEWRNGVQHGFQFYSMIINFIKSIIEQSKRITYMKSQIDSVELKRRMHKALDWVKQVLQISPVLENLNWRAAKPPEVPDPLSEGADIIAQMRAYGITSVVNLIENSVTIISKLAAKEMTQNFDDVPKDNLENVPSPIQANANKLN